jgi:predicted alpha/beta hydrolase family esterase
MVPGHGGSGPDHWQSAWERELGAQRIDPSSWNDVDEADWRAAISRGVQGPTVLVAHSLGCLVVAEWLADAPRPGVVGAFLVAPPDRRGPLFPPTRGLDATPSRLGVPAVVVSSSDDPYGGTVVARELASAWGAELIDVGALGHINAASGLGDWPQGRELLRAFAADLG